MKKKMMSIILAGTLVLGLTGCSEKNSNQAVMKNASDLQAVESVQVQLENETNMSPLSTDTKTEKIGITENTETFNEAYLQFAFHALKASKENGENIMISPLSVMTALSMTANGADTQTLKEMEEVLFSGESLDKILPEFLYYLKYLPSSEKASFKQANSIWVSQKEGLSVREEFLQKNAESFQAEIFQADFDEHTLQAINQWVDIHTNGMIPKILDRMDPTAVMYLINAISFEAEWAEVYPDYQIHENEIFTNAVGKEEKVTMLYSTEQGYLEDDNTTGFIKPYQGGYSFVALLPSEGIAVDDYLDSLTGEKWNSLMNSLDYKPVVNACIPEFKSEYQTEMSEILSEMGMPSAFSTEAADFSKMATIDRGNISINRVIHKTFIELNRNGTKASASTAVEMVECCTAIAENPVIKEVYLDRPFIYAIIDSASRLPIFVGVAEHIR